MSYDEGQIPQNNIWLPKVFDTISKKNIGSFKVAFANNMEISIEQSEYLSGSGFLVISDW